MHAFKSKLFPLLLLAWQALLAGSSCDLCYTTSRCDPLCWWGRIEGVGEILYWRPSYCQNGFVIKGPADTELPQGDELGARRNRGWGYRVGLGYLPRGLCGDVRGTFCCLRTHDHMRVKAGLDRLWPEATVAKQAVKTEYYAIEVQVAQRQRCWRLHEGLHFAHLHQRRALTYDTTQVTEARTIWGIGPELGGEWRYVICQAVGLSSRGGGGLLAGKSRTNQCRVIALGYVVVGLNYLYCNPAFTFLAEIGYEWRSYVNACNTISYDGLNLRFRLNF